MSPTFTIGQIDKHNENLLRHTTEAAVDFHRDLWGAIVGRRVRGGVPIVQDTGLLLRRLADNEEFAEFEVPLRTIYEGIRSASFVLMQQRAERMSDIISKGGLFAVVNYPEDTDDVFAAPIVGVEAVPYETSYEVGGLEPIIQSIQGVRGLLPKESHLFKGLYGVISE